MKRHTKIYLDHFHIGYNDAGVADFIPCEWCGNKAVDIHHLSGRGKNKDVIENLIALCRNCHQAAHDQLITRADLKLRHWHKLRGK